MKFHPRMGWRPDTPDPRDVVHRVPAALLRKLPPAVDLRHAYPKAYPGVYEQGQLGSCTGNATGFLVQFDRMKQKLPHAELVPSRLMIYWLAREIENSTASDAGAEIRDTIKAMAKTGTCFEEADRIGAASWPYDIARFAEKPPQGCYDAAAKDRAIKYARITPPQTLNQMRGCLAQGFPFVFGFLVYESFMSDAVTRTGIVPMPTKAEIAAGAIGGHAVVAVGYDAKRFLCRNSWGDWGFEHGHFWMPNAYMTNSTLVSDLWQIGFMEV